MITIFLQRTWALTNVTVTLFIVVLADARDRSMKNERCGRWGEGELGGQKMKVTQHLSAPQHTILVEHRAHMFATEPFFYYHRCKEVFTCAQYIVTCNSINWLDMIHHTYILLISHIQPAETEGGGNIVHTMHRAEGKRTYQLHYRVAIHETGTHEKTSPVRFTVVPFLI